jgi:chorismate dehydratase
MPIKVAHIPNLECEAFYFDMERRGIELLNLEPNAVTEALERGEVDAGPVPLVDTWRLTDKAVPVHGFCVASVSRATASILHSREPIEALGSGRIVLGASDAASVALLRVLLAQKYNVCSGTFVDEQADHNALLLTGNPCLRRRRGLRGYPHRYDLGEEWQAWTGLPFVFSRWMASNRMERQNRVVLDDALFVGQEDWMNNLYKATGPRNDLLMLPREVLEYVQGLRFFIGVPEERSMALFQEKLALLEDV